MNCKSPKWLEASGDRRFFVCCGKCLYCRMMKRREWTLRMMHEAIYWDDIVFVTWTYDEEHLPPRGLYKKELQGLFKRLRRQTGLKFKYYACGEYGEKSFRAHYHAIIFGLDMGVTVFDPVEGVYLAVEGNPLFDCWEKGRVQVSFANEDCMRYVAQYIDKKVLMEFKQKKDMEFNDFLPPFQLCSQGIGLSWVRDNVDTVLRKDGITFKGRPQPIPRYYLEKVKDLAPFFYLTERVRMEEDRHVREADVTNDLMPWTGGKRFDELSEDERDCVNGWQQRNGDIMCMNLKAQAEIHKLGKKRSI